jgi:hypothetical protein
MSFFQLFVGLFGLACVAVSLLAVWRVARAPNMRLKLLWIAGSLFGFVGLAVDGSAPNALIVQFGLQVPVVMVSRVGLEGPWAVKALFPLIALAAIASARRAQLDVRSLTAPFE